MKIFFFVLISTFFVTTSLWAQGDVSNFKDIVKNLEAEDIHIPANGVIILVPAALSNEQSGILFNDHIENGTPTEKIILYQDSNFKQSSLYQKLKRGKYKIAQIKDNKLLDFAKTVSKSMGPYAIYLQNKNLQFLVKVGS